MKKLALLFIFLLAILLKNPILIVSAQIYSYEENGKSVVSAEDLTIIGASSGKNNFPEINQTQDLVLNNPDFAEYLEPFKDASGLYNFGQHEELYSVPLKSVQISGVPYTDKTVSPTRYDARNSNLITPVKDQGAFGTCWAFAAMNVAEANMIKDGNSTNYLDLSEVQQAYFLWHRVADPLNLITNDQNIWTPYYYSADRMRYWIDSGGNGYMNTFLLSSWTGATKENMAPYPSNSTNIANYSLNNSLSYQNDIATLQNSFWVLLSDQETIKQMIMKYGAAYVSFYAYFSSEYYNESTHAYYCPEDWGTNHAVSIVGWDDNFSKSNFSQTPVGDGAWLIKNSWGSEWGDNGYFWISYYDNTIYSDVFFYDFEPGKKYDNNYQYDGTKTYSALRCSDGLNSITTANVFTTKNEEFLTAVAYTTPSTNYKFEIKIYTDLSGTTNPRNGTLVKTLTGSELFAGYHTIKLPQSIPLRKGSKFSVVVKIFGTPINQAWISLDMASSSQIYDYYGNLITYQQTVNSASRGLSFYQIPTSETLWLDMYEDGGNSWTPRIKAFTANKVKAQKPKNDFNGDGKTDIAVFRPSNGTWYVKGQFTTKWGEPGDIAVSGDYNGDGKADIAVFRPSNGKWFVKNQFTTTWGETGDIPVPGDYNGDGKTDVAVFRPSNGNWYIKNQTTTTWGETGDIPIPGDYNGDRKTDIAVFRPSIGKWFVRNQFSIYWGQPGDIPVPGDYNGDGKTDVATFNINLNCWFVENQMEFLSYGEHGDIPVPGDYNGDGKTDVAVFRPSNGKWYIKNQSTTTWGVAGDYPVSKLWRGGATTAPNKADFNGDGKTDVAVFRPSTGKWYVKDQFSTTWGVSGDIPVSGDYNGDGKTDVGVFRPSNGKWYIKGRFTTTWGVSGDIPVPGDYNGDLKTDVAVFRPSTGRWWIKDQFTTAWGESGDIPVPGDYNGDGKTDIAIFRPSTGKWWVKNQFVITWGRSGDIPVPRDYNGDGKTDVAIYRESDDTWWVKDRTVWHWGNQINEIPTPGDYNGDGKTQLGIFRSDAGWYLDEVGTIFYYGAPGDIPIP